MLRAGILQAQRSPTQVRRTKAIAFAGVHRPVMGRPASCIASERAATVLSLASEQVSGASLRFFRVVFGVVVAGSAVRLLLLDWTTTLYAEPMFHFRYAGMGWIPVLPPWLFRVQVALIALAALLVAAGIRYRAAMVTVFILFSWMEFTEATVYLNHYWFITVMSALAIFLPLDAVDQVRRGAVWMVRFQVGLVYCFAGLAKLTSDWLVDGLPLALWLPGRSAALGMGSLLDGRSAAIILSWGGAVFDCSVVAFLLWRRTRLAAWCVVVAFHVATFVLFPTIGVFPFLMVGSSLVFFDPAWPTVLRDRALGAVGALGRHSGGLEKVGSSSAAVADSAGAAAAGSLGVAVANGAGAAAAGSLGVAVANGAGAAAAGSLGVAVANGAELSHGRTDDPGSSDAGPLPAEASSVRTGRLAEPRTVGPTAVKPLRLHVVMLAVVWMAVQLAIPLRQYVVPGDARWTGEGFRFGWNVLAVERVGSLDFRVTDATTQTTFRRGIDDLFTRAQMRVVPSEPELVRQAAHYVAQVEARRLGVPLGSIQVRADSFVSVNGRAARRLIDPNVDLATQPTALWHADWILPVGR